MKAHHILLIKSVVPSGPQPHNTYHFIASRCNTFNMKPRLKKLLDLLLFFLMNVIINGTDVVTDAITAWALCKQINIEMF